MLTTLLIIYLVGALITSAVAAYQTGVEQKYMTALNPQPYAVNWVNNFFQSVLWLSHWACVLGKVRTGSPSMLAAKKYFGMKDGQ